MANKKFNNPYFHIIYWIFIIFLLVLIFGGSWKNTTVAFYFISLLLPVIMATSYFFNYILVPRFLLQKKYFQFALYFSYTIIISLFLEMLVLTFTFIYLLNFHIDDFNPNAKDALVLAIIMYMVVFLSSFLIMVMQLYERNKELVCLKENSAKFEKSFLQVISKRKPVRINHDDICFIESHSDYITVHILNNDPVISREKITNIEKELPDTFIRIHRSFIVNKQMISFFDYNSVTINDIELNIGRTYKKEVLSVLKSIG